MVPNGPIRPVHSSSSLHGAFRLLACHLDPRLSDWKPVVRELSIVLNRCQLLPGEQLLDAGFPGPRFWRRRTRAVCHSLYLRDCRRSASEAVSCKVCMLASNDEMSVPMFREQWNVCASEIAKRTHNPIRSIIENIIVEPNPSKQMIALSIGKFVGEDRYLQREHLFLYQIIYWILFERLIWNIFLW